MIPAPGTEISSSVQSPCGEETISAYLRRKDSPFGAYCRIIVGLANEYRGGRECCESFLGLEFLHKKDEINPA